jgi:hypothetical protein
MCNYMTAIPGKSRSVAWGESFLLSSLLLSRLAVDFKDEDDNRGSGR